MTNKPYPLPHTKAWTSKEAARLMEPAAKAVRALVYRLISQAGKQGMTDSEIFAATARRISENTLRPRRVELWDDALIKDSGRTRKTRSGFQAIVWVVKS